MLIRAKLAAALVFGGAFAVALNAVPSILYPLFLTMNLRGMTGRGVMILIVAHATSVVLAGWFGFFTILAVRGVVRFITGERGFRRVSSPIQSSLVVCAITALLLAPGVRKTLVHDWVAETTPARWAARPALWFLGVNESLAGQVIARTPVVLPPRIWFIGRLQKDEREGRAAYLPLLPAFAALAHRGWIAVPLVALLSVIMFLWNDRRLPEATSATRGPSRVRDGLRRVAERLVPDCEARAGFFFTWQTLTRSTAHRTIVAVAVAAGLTHGLMALAASGVHRVAFASAPRALIAINNVVLVCLLAGFRHAVTVPPEFAANWTIRMAWLGDAGRYLAGVTRAALIIVVVLPLLLLAALNIALFGAWIAAAHSLAGLLLAVVVRDALFLNYRQVPFACSYTPIENPKLVWPAGLATGLLITYGFAAIEARALQTPPATMVLVTTLTAMILSLRIVDRNGRANGLPVDFDERPRPATQRLGLFDAANT